MTNPAIDGLEHPKGEAASRQRAGVLAFAFATVWMVIWQSNVMRVLGDVLPVSPYYVVIAPYFAYLMATRPVDCLRLTTRPMFWLWLLTALLPLVMYLSSPGLPDAYASLRVRIVLFSGVIGSAILLTVHEPLRLVRTAATIVLFVAVPLNLVELLFGDIFTIAPGRAAGFYENPNISAAAIILALLFCVDLSRQTRRSLLLMTFGFVGVMTTFSRSGMIFGAALWLYHAFLSGSGGRANPLARVVLVFALIMAFIAGSFVFANVADVSPEARARVTQTLQGRADDGSAMGRIDRLQHSWRSFRRNFWTGHGLGAPEYLDLQSHNTYLHLGNEFGILGLIAFLSLLAVPLARAVFARPYRSANTIALVAFVLYQSMFDHYVHSSPVFAVAFGVLLIGGLTPPRGPAAPRARYGPSLPGRSSREVYGR